MSSTPENEPTPPLAPSLLSFPARLFLISFLSLFLEMLIIRWLSTEVRLFAHIKNITLIACFAGLGFGYSYRRTRVSLLLPLAGIALLTAASQPVYVMGAWTLKNLTAMVSFDQVYSFHPIQNWGIWIAGQLLLLMVFLVVVAIFFPLGQALGELFRTSDNLLRDYTINLAASILGILAFTLLSVLKAPPYIWFLAGLLPLLVLLPNRKSQQLTGMALLLVTIFIPVVLGTLCDGVIEVVWSPYQKIQVWQAEAFPDEKKGWTVKQTSRPQGGFVMHMLDVNDTAMMWLLDMSREAMTRNPWLRPPGRIEWYDFPYRIMPAPQKVLILGAGGGNDTAAALRSGAQHVDAVEIDPVIVELGAKYHQEKPYLDPRVKVHITDARRFLQTTPERYDVIVFGQLDNTDYNLMSNFSNIRMDSYIYTCESFRSAFRLLKPTGIMVVNFGANDWWGERVTRILFESTGQKALGFRNDAQFRFQGRENTYIVGNTGLIGTACARDRELAEWVKNRQSDWKISGQGPSITDDWPFWYLPQRGIPSLYLVVMAFIILLSLVMGKFLLREGKGFQGHFFFLGAAFMLLEVHLINKMALLFGSTWMVNAAVIASVLLMMIGANLLLLRMKSFKPWWSYLLLALFLVAQWLLPPNRFLNMNEWFSLVVTLLLYSLPIFFAGLIFARSFKDEPQPDYALGCNLLGAICGGMLEGLSYILGMGALVGIALGLYAISALFLYFRSTPTLSRSDA